MECQYCKNIFKTKSILKSHKQNAKYCKKIQEVLGIEIKYLYNCEFCSKSFSQKIDLQRHYTICKKREVISVENSYKLSFSSENDGNFMISNPSQCIKLLI